MFASLTILPHFADSILIIAANSDGVLAIGSAPSPASFAFTSGWSSALAISFCNRSTTAGGVAAGATMLYHDVTSKPGNPIRRASAGGRGRDALRARDAERAQLAAGTCGNRRRRTREHDLHVARDTAVTAGAMPL
jgi:hypothetical protein